MLWIVQKLNETILMFHATKIAKQKFHFSKYAIDMINIDI